MSAFSFASLICSKVRAAVGINGAKYNKETSQLCQQAIASGITEYLLANTKVHISYTGIMNEAPHGADPVVSDIMKITGACQVMSTPRLFDEWVKELQTNIASGFSVVVPGENGVNVSFKPFNLNMGALKIVRNNLRIAHEGNRKDPMQKTWEVICQGIMNWINSSDGLNLSAKQLPANRENSSGTSDLVKIVIV